jgi:glycyl-tRNA synthetase beta chain
LFKEASETALFDAYLEVKTQMEQKMAESDLEGALRVVATLREPVDKFFEDVMVMTEDQVLRNNRLALLQSIAALFGRMADFSKIAT